MRHLPKPATPPRRHAKCPLHLPRRSSAYRYLLSMLSLSVIAPAALHAQVLPAVPVPAENPITEEKRILGKLLFWEEQLSSDNTVACGTCHLPEAAGADPRRNIHPGPDGSFGTADDIIGSEGVVRRDASGNAILDPIFGFDPQVTGRATPSYFNGIWSPEQFWDGRGADTFVDPLDGITIRIASGGGLESQSVAPILSDVEMAKENRTWAEVTAKLATVTPLAQAIDVPADMAAAIALGETYPDLFASAFGDSAITPTRIAFAIATYERTLVADQTPWDAFIAGDTNALNANEQQGWTVFLGSPCAVCHLPGTFTNHEFRNIGLRNPSDDRGREEVTSNAADRAQFKVPSLRNLGVRPTFMHTGELATTIETISFYRAGTFHFPANLDPLMPVDLPPGTEGAVADFLNNGLLDPRVANASFPFDRPTLLGTPRVPALPGLFGAGAALGIGGLATATLRRRKRST